MPDSNKMFRSDLIRSLRYRSNGYRCSDHSLAALAAATGGGASVSGGAGVLGRPGRGEDAYRARRAMLMLKVGSAGQGACCSGWGSSSELRRRLLLAVAVVAEVWRRPSTNQRVQEMHKTKANVLV